MIYGHIKNISLIREGGGGYLKVYIFEKIVSIPSTFLISFFVSSKLLSSIFREACISFFSS